jgi:hypothetical protein
MMHRPCTRLLRRFAAALPVAFALACNGTTGDALVTFTAYAAGAPHAGDPFTVNIPGNQGASTAYTVQIKSATIHIGALYLNQNPQDDESCISPGLYSDQVLGAIDVDLLSTTPQAFSLSGNGTADPNQSFTLWLTDGGNTLPASIGQQSDTINSANYDPTVLLQAVATNQATGASLAFSAIVTINAANRGTTPSDPAYPGGNPICQQRLVSVPLHGMTVVQGDGLLLTIDPRNWFGSTINFADFVPITSSDCLGDPTLEAPDFPDVGISPTECIPNTDNTSNTNGAPIGAQFLTNITAGNAETYALSILPSQ